MKSYQIRDKNFGLALYDAESPRDALLAYFADRAKGEVRHKIKVADDRASVDHDGKTFHAVPLPAPNGKANHDEEEK